MSADYGTRRYKGYGHLDQVPPYIHVTHRSDGEPAMGSFSLAEIAELAQLAGQAWPGADGLDVRYVIEVRRPSGDVWRQIWSAVADDDFAGGGVSEEFAAETLAGMRSSQMEWRLTRRTTVVHVEDLTEEGGQQ